MRLLIVLILVVALTSCERGDSPPPETTPLEVDPTMEVTQEPVETSAMAAPTALVPLAFGIGSYPGAKPLGDSPDFMAENKNTRWLQYETPDAPEKVIAFYKAEADKAGFTVTEDTEKKLAKSMQIKAERPQGGSLRVNTMVQKDGKTFINVHVGEDL